MNQTVQIEASASRALRTAEVRKICVRAISLVRRKSLTLAVMSAALCYAGALLGRDPLTYTAAFAAFGFVSLADSGSAKKGGEI